MTNKMKLTVKPGKRSRVYVYLDEEYKASVDATFWYSERWSSLEEIEEAEAQEMLLAIDERRAFDSLLDLLSRRMHTRLELSRKLSQKYSKEAVEAALSKAQELSLLNDAAFAETYAEELSRVKHYAAPRIRMALLEKGVDRETAENVLLGLDKDDKKSIIVLLQTKYRNQLADEKGKRRAVNGLLRMGYSYSDIFSALDAYREETEEF